MEPKPVCVFCGVATDEIHKTSLGVMHIHAACWLELEEIYAREPREQRLMGGDEDVKERMF